ncbi:MAG: hypothetical protein ACI9CO_002367 [Candidatus Azotimanducaceae bacterium]|jgi:hypothetical protein
MKIELNNEKYFNRLDPSFDWSKLLIKYQLFNNNFK